MANATTKAVNLTEDEIKDLIISHGRELAQFNVENVLEVKSDKIERINYLHKRLKAFSEPEKADGKEEASTAEAAPAPAPATAAAGW